MDNIKNRKYPRVYNKNKPENKKERIVDISAAAAVGILAAVFVKGMFWGYLLKRQMS